MSDKKVEFNFVMDDHEMPGFYSQELAFSPIVNICFEVNAVFVAHSNRGDEIRFFLPFIKRLFGYSTAETIELISETIVQEEGKVDVVTSESTDWFCVFTQTAPFLTMRTACQVLATMYRKRQPGSPIMINHTRPLYNFINVQHDAKDPADEPNIEAMYLLRLAELRRALVFPLRLRLTEEELLYKPFELSEKKLRWVSHLNFFGYYEQASQAPDAATSTT